MLLAPHCTPSQGCTSSHRKWEDCAYLSSPQTPASLLASACFCWVTLNTDLLSASGSSSEKWVPTKIWTELGQSVNASPRRKPLKSGPYVLFICVSTPSPGLGRVDTDVWGSLRELRAVSRGI